MTLPNQSRQAMMSRMMRLALPVILTNLLQSLVAVVDTFMVGRLGPIQIAAVGMSNAIRLLVLVLLLSVTGGAMSLISQAKGARDPDRMSHVTRQSITSGILLSLVMGVGGYFISRPLLTLVNSGGEMAAVDLGTAYLQIIFLGTPFVVLNFVFNRLMQGAGDTVTPLILTGSMNLLNILFNYLLMFGPGPLPAYGLNGAAYGTVLARFIGVIIGFWIIYSGRNVIKVTTGTYWPDWRMIGDIFAIGVPSGLQGVFRNGSRLLVIGLVTATELGTYGAAALAIGLQVESLAFMPVLGINVAATALVGQELGKWQTKQAWQNGNMTILFGVIIMVILMTPLILFAPAIIALFDPSAHPLLAEGGVAYLRINTIFLPFTAISMVTNGAMRGAGDTTPGMLSTFFSQGLITVLMAWLLAFPLGMGSTGVWYGLVIGVIVNGCIMGGRWLSGAWVRVALRKSEIYREHLHKLPQKIQSRFLAEVRTPLMAIPKTLELVDKEGVMYHQTGQDIRYIFEKGGYQQYAQK